jgi:uncharacterized protein YbaR (Trm112 family)
MKGAAGTLDLPPLSGPRIQLICPGCRHVHEHPAEERGGTAACPECGREFHAPETVPVIYMPWEDRGRLGWLRALYETVRTSLLAPKAFFSRMPVSGGWSAPLSYAGIMCVLSAFGASLWLFVLPEAEVAGFHVTLSTYPGLVLQLMLRTVAVLAFYGALVHLAVSLFKGGPAWMQTTARVVAYASGALLLALLPYIGPPLAGLWTLVLCVVGLREAQELTTGKAVVAAFSPILLITMLLSGLFRAPAQR